MIKREDIEKVLEKHIDEAEIIDVHTHLFPEQFGDLCLWGPDELITYHYLVAEVFRTGEIGYDDFWEMTKKQQADLIFKSLFVERSPLSEACRGILTNFSQTGIRPGPDVLEKAREKIDRTPVSEYVDFVFEKSGVKKVIMTNDPFDDKEREVWDEGVAPDKRFMAALRIDTLLNDYQNARYKLIDMGYDVGRSLNGIARNEIRRFLKDWIEKIDAAYMAVSLPPDFIIPGNNERDLIIEECVIPVAIETGKPFAMMIGVKKLLNQDLRLAGDGVGKSEIETVEYLCSKYPDAKFMVTMLSRENQHELCVAARKFPNLFIFGCWWFLNNPMLIEEMTRMRMELLGTLFLPQHSDARVLDQLIYKWKHSKKIILKVLTDKYTDLFDTGWPINESDIQRDVEKLFGGNFTDFLERGIQG